MQKRKGPLIEALRKLALPHRRGLRRRRRQRQIDSIAAYAADSSEAAHQGHHRRRRRTPASLHEVLDEFFWGLPHHLPRRVRKTTLADMAKSPSRWPPAKSPSTTTTASSMSIIRCRRSDHDTDPCLPHWMLVRNDLGHPVLHGHLSPHCATGGPLTWHTPGTTPSRRSASSAASRRTTLPFIMAGRLQGSSSGLSPARSDTMPRAS